MEKGRRLFANKITGALILDTGEFDDIPTISTVDEDFATYPILKEFNREAVIVVDLAYEELKQDFREGRLMGIDPLTKELLFSYLDPSTPGIPIPPQPSLSLQVKELADIIAKQSLTADDIYKNTNIDQSTLEELIYLKVAQLDYFCNKTILSGFTSDVLGESHLYGFDTEDQSNLSGALSLMNANPSLIEIEWKPKNELPVIHSREQFIQLCTDSFIFKQSQIGKYWFLKTQSLSAISKEEVDSINWN